VINSFTIVALAIAIILLSIRMRKLAAALAEQAQITNVCIELIASVGKQLNTPPELRAELQLRDLERLEQLLQRAKRWRR
jgi:S-adenosylmethionine synthetase